MLFGSGERADEQQGEDKRRTGQRAPLARRRQPGVSVSDEKLAKACVSNAGYLSRQFV